MAGPVEEVEDFVIVAVIAGIAFLAFWLLGGFKAIAGLLSGDSGVQQSFTNAAAGFPSGADPGTVPLFQQLQGFFESVRNFGGYVFGSSNGPEYTPKQAAAIDAQIASYQPMTAEQVNNAVQNFSSNVNNFASALQSNPGSLPIF